MKPRAGAEPDTSSPTLEELLRSYQEGDGGAAAALVRAVSPLFLRYCVGLGDRAQDAEDTLQEIWLRVHRARHTFHPGAPALPWLYAIARHARLDAYRRRQRKHGREVQVDEMPEVAATEPSREAAADLAPLLAALPPAQREVIVLLKGSGMSLEDVARATSSTVGAVKQKAHRAYTRLRLLLRENARAR